MAPTATVSSNPTSQSNRNKKDTTNHNCRIAFLFLVAELAVVTLLACNMSLPRFTMSEASASSSTATDGMVKRAVCMRADQERFNDIKFLRLVGAGVVNHGFEAILDGERVIAKIAGDGQMYWSDIEIDIFDILNEPPTISNIPRLLVGIRSMPNPFHDVAFLEKNLSVSIEEAKRLVTFRRISVLVMKFLPNSERPSTLRSVQKFAKSMLETLAFAHSRGVMNCDLHGQNYHFDGITVSLYDWNGGFLYEKDNVPMHSDQAPAFLMPPEAQTNLTAVHATVSAFDIYSVGRLLKIRLKQCCKEVTNMKNGTSRLPSEGDETNENHIYQQGKGHKEGTGDSPTCSQMYDLANRMQISDPYQRPSATELLLHPVFV